MDNKLNIEQLKNELLNFQEFNKSTSVLDFADSDIDLPVYVNEFWTSKQRAAHSLHEVSYRACFKPQLPRFFINRLTEKNDIVYDPFMGRGTTVLESALLSRIPVGCDINPLSKMLLKPRLTPPSMSEIKERLSKIDLEKSIGFNEELLVFFHPDTLRQICNLRNYLSDKENECCLDPIDEWIRMVATNRLTGHSTGFFSVYTLPPNQAVSIDSQKKINDKRNQVPPKRDIVPIILKKSKSLLSKLNSSELKRLHEISKQSILITGSCDSTPEFSDSTINLVVTSPPFLDVVNYQQDNWLRCWFNNIDSAKVSIWQFRRKEDWIFSMNKVFKELYRVLVPGGYVAFEVGEVRRGKILMETMVVPTAVEAGLKAELLLVNDQVFTKTANCWGISNTKQGTNTNRIILLRKDF